MTSPDARASRARPCAQRTAAKLVFDTDFRSKAQVIKLARALGANCIVVKHDDRPTFNITHYARRDRWDVPGVTVVWWPAKNGPLPTPTKE